MQLINCDGSADRRGVDVVTPKARIRAAARSLFQLPDFRGLIGRASDGDSRGPERSPPAATRAVGAECRTRVVARAENHWHDEGTRCDGDAVASIPSEGAVVTPSSGRVGACIPTLTQPLEYRKPRKVQPQPRINRTKTSATRPQPKKRRSGPARQPENG